jgi:hypothetical protein
MALGIAAEGSRSGVRKTYITCATPRGYGKQKKASGSKCDHRKSCGTTVRIIPRKK